MWSPWDSKCIPPNFAVAAASDKSADRGMGFLSAVFSSLLSSSGLYIFSIHGINIRRYDDDGDLVGVDTIIHG